ncbi:Mur ligase family protein [Acidimicrobiaceae bacterium]|nr:Mur ligase family protein [Acidimicrobiaceae bacterium]
MNLVDILTLALITIATCINSVRWERIAQREHYIPSYVSKFYFRWVRSRGLNRFIFFITLILCILSLYLRYVPILICAVNLITPIGLSFKPRTSKVEKTERLKRASYLYFFLVIFISLASFTRSGYLVALAANMFSYFIYDQSLRLLYKFEKNKSRHFVNDASKKLNSVQIPVIGITGSYSKTTTKNVLAQILGISNNVFVTPESYNNRLGIAKSINENFQDDQELAIIEMGTYSNGEIREICSWVRPHVSVITGIAPVHLERMKSLENILDAKSEIVELAGSVVINGDDEMLLTEARLWTNQKNVYDCSITSREATVCVEYEDGKHDIYVANNLLGSINGPKLLQLSISLSIGVMLALDLDIREYINNLDTLDKSKHRQNILKSDLGHTIIDNSFNSNPMGIEYSLETLQELGSEESVRYLVTPGMVELGSDQYAINYAFALEASQVVDKALIVGKTNKNSLKAGFQENDVDYEIFQNRDEAVNYLNSVVKSEDIVLYENDLPDHYP